MNNLKNKNPNILVIGDLMIDHYLWGSCDRISPEAPVQVLNVKKETTVLGGAGNVINNLYSLGASVDVIGVIGDDSIGSELEIMINNISSNSNLIVEKERLTSKKSRLIASNQQIIRYDKESCENICSSSEEKILNILEKNISKYEIILLSDYGKGVLTNKLTKNIISLVNSKKKKVIIDPKGSDYTKYKGAYLLTPNKKEASEATKINIKDDTSLLKAITKLKDTCNLKISLITLSEDGIAILNEKLRIKPTIAKEVYDVTGAGDTVLASIGFCLACKLNIEEAIDFANLAAGIVVGKLGNATASLNEIIEYKSSLHKSTSYSHIKTLDEIKTISQKLKEKGKKIVFTNGCFDILHIGHIKYLETAKSFGDILILGLNSDSSVKRLKGDERPINTQNDRAYIVAALESVDYVVLFDDDTPYELIKEITPHILVKGGDYRGKNIIGQDLVEELKIVEFITGKSTSNIIQKIKEY
jgi:D-beta-D-heptose 7-phosphate kinase/D-beta-D-heptose 1-phosphate adenosyltransferase